MKDQLPDRTGLFYGSSITHGNATDAPSQTYVGHIGRMLGIDTLNLGFGGGAFLETAVAEHIAQRQDWDFAHLELGINMLCNKKASVSSFATQAEAFIQRIHQAHPQKTLYISDLFTFHASFINVDTATAYRQALQNILVDFKSEQIVHLGGEHYLQDPLDFTADLLHPSPQGMLSLANQIGKAISKHQDQTH